MTTAVEFGSKDAADAVRDDYPGALCSQDDDRRLKTVRFSSDAPEHVVEDARRRADQSRAERESGPGQVDLTDGERERIDFSEGNASVPHARAVKAIARSEGVDDWLAYYDATLQVDEHRDLMERATRDEQGRRLDAETSATTRAGEAAAKAEGEECDHARGHCEHGDAAACEFLRERCDYDVDEVDRLLNMDPEAAEARGTEITGKSAGALQRAWSGYKGATARADDAFQQLAEEWRHAQQAGKAINRIREQHGQEPLHFENLEAIQGEFADLTREAAADCHECHADHADHAHPGPEREPLGNVVEATDHDVREAVETTTEADS